MSAGAEMEEREAFDAAEGGAGPRVAVFRADRLGDVVLSTPVAELLKTGLGARVTFVVREYARPVLDGNPFIDQVLTVDGLACRELAGRIRGQDASIALYASREAVWAPWLAGIPLRVGPLSRLRDLLFNRRFRQHRSACAAHEAEYNMDLARRGFGLKGSAWPRIFLSGKEEDWAAEYLKARHGLEAGQPFVLLHPGSGGSSKDLPLDKYRRIAEKLAGAGVSFLVSGNAEELAKYREEAVFKSGLMKEALPLRRFLALISRAGLLAGNSSGPLHCAAALDIPTVSFYPPLRVCSVRRWGPFSASPEKHLVFSPDGPVCDKCPPSCRLYPCMESLDAEKIFAGICGMLNGGSALAPPLKAG